MARSLNKVELIGNLTRDPELRYTPAGTAVCTFGLATNRQWTTDSGEKKEEAEFHRIVAWNKLAELCAQLLTKGRKVYVEGRLQTRHWTGQDGQDRTSVEVVIRDMIILDSRGAAAQTEEFDIPEDVSLEEPPVEVSEEGQEVTAKDSSGSSDTFGSSDNSQVQNTTTKASKTDSKKMTSSKSNEGEGKKEEEQEVPSDDDIPF